MNAGYWVVVADQLVQAVALKVPYLEKKYWCEFRFWI
jgi:hypothetical protein